MRMNLPCVFTVFALFLSALSIQAESVSLNTTPKGIISFPLQHGVTTYLSLPVEADPTYSGAVASTTANSITVADNPTPWTAGELTTPAQPYFVKFLTGPEAGRIVLITANTTNILTLDTTDHSTQTTPLLSSPASSFDVQAGDTFEIFPGETLATLFGTGTTQDPVEYLIGSTNITQADVVSVFTTSTAPALSYFFDTGKSYWRLYPSTANANNAIIYPYSSLAITRRITNGDAVMPMMGGVSSVALLIKTLGKATKYSSTQYAADVALSQLQLGPSWTKGTSVTNSDVVAIWNAGTIPGHFDSYYQLSTDSTWRKYPNKTTDVSSFVIPAGTAICITKREFVSGEASYLQPPLPYDLN